MFYTTPKYAFTHRLIIYFLRISFAILITSMVSVLIDGVVIAFHASVVHAATDLRVSRRANSAVNKTWYFAEGRVGNGFEEFLTLENPDPAIDCSVTIQYTYSPGGTPTPLSKTVKVLVAHASRLTEKVNNDLNYPVNQAPAANVSTTLSVDSGTTPSCTGIVAERPMYFQYQGVNSGSDVLGATTLSTTAYFADMQTLQTQTSAITSFLTILNPPSGNTANIVAHYYSGGQQVGSQNLTVNAGTRGTISPNSIGLPPHVAVVVNSDQPVLIERPSYFKSVAEGNAGTVSSADSVVGQQQLHSDILFAEGYTGNGFQEYLALANVSATAASATVKLEYQNGHTQTVTTSVAAYEQTFLDVNQLGQHPTGTCDTNPCSITLSVSAEIQASVGIVAERQMYFHYHMSSPTQIATGGTDVTGGDNSTSNTIYNFAEGYTNTGYNEWLTLQNPTDSAETLYITIVNGLGRTYTAAVNVGAVSRGTVNITALVIQHLVRRGDPGKSYEVSITVQSNNSARFLAERPMYWNTTGSAFPTQGGSDIIGYGALLRSSLIAWNTFDGDSQRSGVNSDEMMITPNNVGSLARLWQQTLPATADSSPVELPNVSTSGGVKNVLFVTTMTGSLLALDAATGNQLWRQNTSGAASYTTSSPVLDPSGQYVYSYGLDGKVHKYAVGNGNEVTSGGWPATITLMPNVEKGSSALNIGNGYLYMTTSGYPGDGGHYEGHVVAVNLTTGTTTVFNSLCANIHQLLDSNSHDSNYCPDVQSGIWARGGVVIDPVTHNVFITTGNGLYTANSGGHDYGDTVVELSPDLSTIIDTYTPSNYVSLRNNDLDLGSDAPALLPAQSGSSTPLMAVQGGKDTTLRLLNRQNLSGQGGPNHVGGELQAIALPQGCDIDTQPTVWTDANNTTWVFVANFCGLSAFKLVTNGQGHSSLQLAYTNSNSGSSPLIANGILFLQSNGVLLATNAATGAVLWQSTQPSADGTIGGLHWQSPIVVNGCIYVPDNSGKLTAYGFPG